MNRLLKNAVSAAALMAVMIAAGSPAVGQDRPQFRTTVELVQLQVTLEDAEGNFPAGLNAEHFVVRVNGQDRPAQVAYEVDLRRAQGDSGAAVVGNITQPRSVTPVPVAARRHFLIFFDFAFTSRRGVLEARRAALDFLDTRAHPEDLIGVATANRFGIDLLAPFSSNHQRARQAVETLGLRDATDLLTQGDGVEESIAQALAELEGTQAGGSGGIGSALDGAQYRDYVAAVTNYQNQMRAFGQMLQAIEGRKHVLFFSRGFDDMAIAGQTLGRMASASDARAQSPEGIMAADPEMLYGTAEVRDNMGELVDMFRQADAAIHAIDPSGGRALGDPSSFGGPVGDLSQGFDSQALGIRNGRQALTALAVGTDGTMHLNLNDLSLALVDIEERTAAFYMIGYSKSQDDPETVDVEVRVRVPGVRVVSAPRALTPPPSYGDMNPVQRQLQLAEFLNDDVERRQISFDSQVVAFPVGSDAARAALLVEVPGVEIDNLARMRGGDQVQFEIAAFAVDQDDTILDEIRRRITIDVEQLRAAGPVHEQSFRYSDLLDVPAGTYRVRMLMREAELGLLSTRTTRFWAGATDDRLRIMRPLVVGGFGAPAPPGSDAEGLFDPLSMNGRRLSFSAAPLLRPGEPFRLLVVAYHVPRDPETGEVLAGLALEAEDGDGEPYRLTEWEILGSAHDVERDVTQLLVQARFPETVPTGSGHLWVRFADRSSGLRVEEQTGIYVQG